MTGRKSRPGEGGYTAYIPTVDDWAPNYPGERARFMVKVLHYPVRKGTRKNPASAVEEASWSVRVVVSGNDDTMAGKWEDYDDEESAVESFYRWVRYISNLAVVSEVELEKIGIVRE